MPVNLWILYDPEIFVDVIEAWEGHDDDFGEYRSM